MSDLAAEIVARVRRVVGKARVIPLHEPDMGPEECAMVSAAVESGWVSSVGPEVTAFESMLQDYTGAGGVALCVNGTAALEMAMRLVGVRPGDEVVMPSLTFVATGNAVAHVGGRPHFADVEPDRLGLDPAALDAHLNDILRPGAGRPMNRKTGAVVGAVMAVHIFGRPANIDGLLEVANAYELPLVEDAAEALGSTVGDRHCGTMGTTGALSFNGNKILTTGGGGAILCSDPDTADRARHLTTTAKRPHRWDFDHDEVAWNYRMPNLNAALGVAQLRRLPDFLARKRALAAHYVAAFADLDGVEVLKESAGTRANHWLTTIRLAPELAAQRDAILDAANDAGIMARPIWRPLHELPMHADAPRGPLLVTDSQRASLISLPSGSGLGPH